jgi:predicted 3-demethylubiquinone-9 3-methyltransferase (glyoxalase superfamily)
MQKIVPHLWYDGVAEEAARRYVELVPGSRLGPVVRYGKAGHDTHGQPEGAVMTQEFELAGTRLVGLNGGPHFRFTPAISLFVTLERRDDVDRAWAGLLDGGEALMPLDAYPWAPRYGWVKDRWGLTWQIAQGDPARSGRAVVPSLMFVGDRAGQAEAAMEAWVGLFPGSEIEGVLRHDGDGPDAAGTVKHAQFRLGAETFMAMDSAGPHAFDFNEAVSLAIMCADQAEIDRAWSALSAVPESEVCGWLKDRFGVSWQVVHRDTARMLGDAHRARADRVMEALLAMGKIDVAALQAASGGRVREATS